MTQPNPFGNQPQPPQPNQPIDEFELMRRRLKARGAVSGKERQQELTRQFAALGNLPSGAAFDIRQKAAEAESRATSEALQDVNILQTQTQRAEREAEAQRQLQREQFGVQRELGQLQAQTALEQARIGERQALGVAGISARSAMELARTNTKSAFDIAQLGARTDLEKARLTGANQFQIAQLQADTALRERQLIEGGTNERLAKQLASNRELFDLEMAFKERGQSLQERLAEFSVDQGQQEMALNKAATVLNSLDPLMALGFNSAEIQDMMGALNLPFADEIGQIVQEKAARQSDVPPPPRKPSNEERFTQAIASAPGDIVNAYQEVISDWFG